MPGGSATCGRDEDDESEISINEKLLKYSRNGETNLVKALLTERAVSHIVDVSCKGQSKANRDWSPLHLASYFGHIEIVEVLIEHGAKVNAVNDVGDTALHKAAYIGRLDIVTLLLKYGADVFIINAEGLTPKYMTRSAEIRDIIEAAEISEERKIEDAFLKAATAGDNQLITHLLQGSRPPNIQCVDKLGNSALHCAAYRDRRETAVLLLQNGISTTAVNNNGQQACDLAQTVAMRQILDVRPVRELQMQVQRFEGQLLKKSKIFGWQQKWVVLDRGVLTVFNTRGDASTGMRMRSLKHLDDCKVLTQSRDSRGFAVSFNDGTTHLYSIGILGEAHVERQRWLNALKSHVAYIAYYTSKGWRDGDDDAEEILPLGSMQDALQSAQAHQTALEKEVAQLTSIATRIAGTDAANGTATAGTGCSSPAVSVKQVVGIQEVIAKCAWIAKCSRDMCQSLSHCMALMSQQEELRSLHLKQEEERSRVLSEALHALAAEHHSLEQRVERKGSTGAIASKSNRESLISSSSGSVTSPASPDEECDNEDEFYECDEFDGIIDSEAIDAAAISSTTTTSEVEQSLVAKLPPEDAQGSSKKTFGRSRLPAPMLSQGEFSVWSILKQCIGKELSKITMPVIFNEPLSFLERIAEYLEYAYLLDKADACSDPVDRMQYVAAFAVSAYASNWNRLGKPFNPLLGETYELDRPELGFRLMCEQVSHHPPVSAFHATAPAYCFHGSILPKLKFWGKSVEITPKGTVTLELLRHKEAYTYENVHCAVHNIIVGKLWVEHHGLMTVVNHTTGHRAELNFRKSSLFSREVHKVDGFITDAERNKQRHLYGSWTEAFYAAGVEQWQQFIQQPTAAGCKQEPPANGAGSSAKESIFNLHVPGQSLLWQANPKPPTSAQFYSFTMFAMMLNEPLPADAPIAPTDSRLRPDVRELENGSLDGAAVCKERLEEKQRETRKVMRKNREEWSTRWFELKTNPYTGKEDWIFTGKYWERQWKDCPDIY